MDKALTCAVFLSIFMPGAQAMDFSKLPLKATAAPTVVVATGEILLGDEKKFEEIVKGDKGDFVLFSSPGGDVLTGIRIDNIIRFRGFLTYVMPGETCYSACALAWLGGGAGRAMSHSAIVGFHGALMSSAQGDTVSGPANAVVGAYLSRLDLSMGAIAFLTSGSPNEMVYLTPEIADRYAIPVELLELIGPLSTAPMESHGVGPPAAAREFEIRDQCASFAGNSGLYASCLSMEGENHDWAERTEKDFPKAKRDYCLGKAASPMMFTAYRSCLSKLGSVTATEDTSQAASEDPVVEAAGDAFCRGFPDMKKCKSLAYLVVAVGTAETIAGYCPGVHYNAAIGNKILSAALAIFDVETVTTLRAMADKDRQHLELCAPRNHTLRALPGLLSFD